MSTSVKGRTPLEEMRRVSARIELLEAEKLSTTIARIRVNPDDEEEYDAACDAHDRVREDLEKAYKQFHGLWQATHAWDPVAPAIIQARAAARAI